MSADTTRAWMHPRLEASAKRERRGLVASESNGSHSCVSVSVFDTVGASSSSPITKDFELELSSSLLDSRTNSENQNSYGTQYSRSRTLILARYGSALVQMSNFYLRVSSEEPHL